MCGGGGEGECALHMEGAMMFECDLQKKVVTCTCTNIDTVNVFIQVTL